MMAHQSQSHNAFTGRRRVDAYRLPRQQTYLMLFVALPRQSLPAHASHLAHPQPGQSDRLR